MLSPGTKLGTYEVTAHIGAGGMGEVYQARDTKLGRDVAIKVLPEQFARDPERLARFQREAKLLAALNHPNIATIHGLEQSGETHYLVMELVPGETLADRIRGGAIPLDEALPIARQIADAIEYAHDNNVIHRDLKPANVKVKPDGTVKVLDFGLAKAMADDPTQGDMSNSPTLSLAATRAGLILGTAPYMSPEQAKGKPVDRRADIWAFGVIVYEMLTGQALFSGETVADTMAQVITKDPSLDALPANTPPAVRTLLQRCLDKNLRRRLGHMSEGRILIEDVLSGAAPATAAASATLAPAPSSRQWMPWAAAAALAIVAAGASFIAWRATRPIERASLRFSDDVGSELALTGVGGPAVAISPDGSRVAYLTRASGQAARISVRLLDTSQASVLAGTEGADGPFFSPDGRWIGFFAGGLLKKISVEGGAAATICETGGNPRGGGFWAQDGNIYIANQTTSVLRVPANGGKPSPVIPLGSGETTNRAAQPLPGGDAILFEASSDNNVWTDATIQVASLKSGQRKTLVNGGYFPRYIHGNDPSVGHLLYMQGDTIFAAPMDARRMELTGPALPVLQNVMGRGANGLAQIAVSESGSMIYVAGAAISDKNDLAWLNPAGTAELLAAPPATSYNFPRLSPDGKKVAVMVDDSGALNLSVFELDSRRMTRLTFVKRIGAAPAWTPDGKHIAFTLVGADLAGPGIYWIRSDGAGEAHLLTAGQNLQLTSFSPDGTRLLYAEIQGMTSTIWTLPLSLADPEHPKAGKPEMFLQSQKDQLSWPVFSPDGRWIAYSSGNAPNTRAIFVRPFPGPGGQWQVSTSGANFPRWARDARGIFYSRGAEIMAAPYEAKIDSFAAGQSQPFSTSERTLVAGGTVFDASPDGKRILAVVPASGATPAPETHVSFLLNFADELRRKVPPEK